ncbi:hypothetical protein Q0M94_25675 (plasmid) [Deinococcus radiomollis]|uniref:hypothetical protein n=1 Tax=Deinococcus radiomollis TaxID=468916 RepID=UPI0038915A10
MLVRSIKKEIRQIVALNPAAPEHVLLLASDLEFEVLEAVKTAGRKNHAGYIAQVMSRLNACDAAFLS